MGQEITQSVGFGMSFLSILFFSALLGYYLGKDIFQLSQQNSYILSLLVGYLTLILETVLFII